MLYGDLLDTCLFGKTMIESDDPRYTGCRIVVSGTRDSLVLIGKRNADGCSISFVLYINDVEHDNVKLILSDKPLVGILEGNSFALHGTLYGDANDDISVRVEGRDNGFTRPEYSFYVGNQVVDLQKGLPRRF